MREGAVRWRDLEFFTSMDGGFNAPMSMHWWLCLPDGRFHICREWKEVGVWAEDLAQRFWKITRNDLGLGRPRYVVAGGDIDAKHGIKTAHGETVFETLQYYGMPMKRADRDRLNGWYRIHELLRPSPYWTPWLTVDPSCTYLIRTIAAAPQDEEHPDELDPHFSDDHALEDVRYGAMSRPSPTVRVRQQAIGDVGRMFQDAMAANRPGVLGAEAVRRSVA